MGPPDISGTIEGSGFKRRASGEQGGAVAFSIRALPWPDQTEPAACQVILLGAGREWINTPIFGVDPFQAMELSIKLVTQLVTLHASPPDQLRQAPSGDALP